MSLRFRSLRGLTMVMDLGKSGKWGMNMAVTIQQVRAVGIIDSVGRPALEVRMDLVGGATGTACVPGAANSPDQLAAILGEVVSELGDASFDELADLDAALRKFDIRDGADPGLRPGLQAAIRAVSIAAARAMASGRPVPALRVLA